MANRPAFGQLMAKATVRERDLFGFPKPGHPYWTAQTLADVAERFPGIDLGEYASVSG
jgi:hypothetical protein